ncbi:hypothetical protein NQG31_03595 [Exiguobacterium alkaliphilum]|uniref:TMhelix containing protein n=1 Tax=Exiguobacterium alkaliphilum TaxID=1428684 RepID=A0ABT2KYC6_9BACL|nr:hypothetical protein [Exiguobacterium alkaliphilum]
MRQMKDTIQIYKLTMLTIIAISSGYIAWHVDELINALLHISSALQALT